MKKANRYLDEDNEFLHPFWLGLLMLFSVIIIMGMICCIRKKYGLHIRHVYNRLRCKNELNNADYIKTNRHIPVPGSYYWAPTYAPPASSSPKFYKLVRNVQMQSIDKSLLQRQTDSTEDSTENEIFSITNRPDQIDEPASQTNKTRNSETARRFYASMRQTSQCPNSSSIESAGNDAQPSSSSEKRFMKSNHYKKSTLFRTPRFFHSITDMNN